MNKYYDYPVPGRPMFHEEILLHRMDHNINICQRAEDLPKLKQAHFQLRRAFVNKVAKYYGLI